MNNPGRISLSAALIVLVCFFLPWEQVSCGASKDTLSGVDLARDGHNGLWLIPLLMLLAIFFSIARTWQERREISSLVSFLAGLVTAYLMNRERLRAEDTSGLLAVRLTGWFWLGFASSIAIVVIAAIQFLKRPRPS